MSEQETIIATPFMLEKMLYSAKPIENFRIDATFDFKKMQFGADIKIRNAMFSGMFYFSDAVFDGRIVFIDCKFSVVDLDDAKFRETLVFQNCDIKRFYFSDATIWKHAILKNCTLEYIHRGNVELKSIWLQKCDIDPASPFPAKKTRLPDSKFYPRLF